MAGFPVSRSIPRILHMSSKRKKLLISIPIVLLLAVGGITLWSLYRWHGFQRAPETHSSDQLLSARGWRISQSHGNKRVYDASIESFSIENAKLGPFAIGPLYVAHLKEVIIDFYAEGLISGEDAGRDPSQQGAFGINALAGPLADIRRDLLFRGRKIRIFDIKGVTLKLWQKEKRVFQISSDRATIDRQTGDIIFVGHASLDAAENGNILSHRIRWLKKTSLFRIKDPFILTTGNSKREGRELETDYLLKEIRYQIKS